MVSTTKKNDGSELSSEEHSNLSSEKDFVRYVQLKRAEIIELKKSNRKQIDTISSSIKNHGKLVSFRSLILYSDRVQDRKGQQVPINNSIVAEISVTGNIIRTTKQTGSSRKGIAVGIDIPGPFSVIFGRIGGKSKGSSTKTKIKDKRKFSLSVHNETKTIKISFPVKKLAVAQQFVEQIHQAGSQFSQIKKGLKNERDELETQLQAIQQDHTVSDLEKELNIELSRAPHEFVVLLNKVTLRCKVGFILGIVSVFACWVPFIGLIIPTVALIFSLQARGFGGDKTQTLVGIITGILSLIIGISFHIYYVVSVFL
jgi:hypothetical protein